MIAESASPDALSSLVIGLVTDVAFIHSRDDLRLGTGGIIIVALVGLAVEESDASGCGGVAIISEKASKEGIFVPSSLTTEGSAWEVRSADELGIGSCEACN